MRGLSRAVPVFLLVVLMGLGFTGCGKQQAEEPLSPPAAPPMGGMIVVGSEATIGMLDPVAGTALGNLRITRMIFENLVMEDVFRDDVTFPPLIPGLAESWTISPDGRTYSFRLRKDVTFHDGTRFDAHAVKFNVDRCFDPAFEYHYARGFTTLNRVYRLVESYRVVDDFTFEIVLKEPFGSFPRLMAHPNFGIVSPTSIRQHGNDRVTDSPVGTGPFKYVERTTDTVVLTRNVDYWGDKPFVDEVVFKAIPEAGTRRSAFLAGEIDTDMMVHADAVAGLQSRPDVTVMFPGQPHVAYILLNMRSTPTQDLRVRQALNHAVDWPSIIKSIYPAGSAVALRGLFPIGNPAYDPDLAPPYVYDPAKARLLLSEAGFGQGFTMKLAYPTSGVSFMQATEMMEMVQAQLAAVGVKLELEPVEYNAFLGLIRPGLGDDMSAFWIGWQSIATDPYMIEQLFGSDQQPPSGNNQGWYANPGFDALLARARVESDPDQRTRLYREAELALLKHAPAMFGVQDLFPRAVSTRVGGVQMGPSPFIDLTKAYLVPK